MIGFAATTTLTGLVQVPDGTLITNFGGATNHRFSDTVTFGNFSRP